MKTKPTRHKETNTFQFKPFSERINEIDIDVFHRVTHRNEENDEEIETYFHQALQKWNVLNLTEGYCELKKKVRNIITLPQLLNQKQYVIDTLKEYLKRKDSLFLQPVLELVVAVARDLQKEFYECFPEFLSIIIDLLQTKDTEQIEYAFISLAYLFKILWRYLIRNVGTVFKLLLPLLADTQPAYINNFAAESFAFVVRKVKDKDSFLKLILSILKDKPNGLPGCGKLLFEVIGGVSGQFHSCAEQMLLLYFNALQDESINQRFMYEVLQQIISCITQNIHPQKSNILWSVILKVIDISIEKDKHYEVNQEREKGLLLILRILLPMIDHKNGRMLTEPVPLIKKLVYLMDIFDNDNDILKEIINVSVVILLASDVRLMQETSSQLLFKIMSVNDTELLYTAIENLIDYPSFETLVLPNVLRYTVSTGFDTKNIQLLAKIIKKKAPPSLNGVTLEKWKKFVLDVRNIKSESINYMLQELKTLTDNTISLDALRILIIMPHLKPLPDELKNILKEGIISLYKKIIQVEDHNDENINRLTFTLLLMLDSFVHIFEPEILHNFIMEYEVDLPNFLSKYNDNIFIFNAIDLCMTYFSKSQFCEEYINEKILGAIIFSTAHKLQSPFSKVRLISTHLYSLFSNVKDVTLSTENTGKNALELMYLAESEPVTIQKYRDRLLHLQGLTFQSYAVSNLNSKYYECPLRYLIGNLYINFSLLWDPVSKVIASYAVNECTEFWSVFISELKSTHLTNVMYISLFDCSVISEMEVQIQKNDDKPDYENHKILLWKCMANFTHFCEIKNRDLTVLFIDFVNNNFFKTNSEDAKSCNIEQHKESIDQEDMEIDNNDDEENKIPLIKNQLQGIQNKSYRTKLLLAQMEIFGKVVNPKTLYREPEIYQIYLDLLSSKNSNIQTAALNCLFTYKHKYLLPYKEHLYNLINEKNFKNELASFKIDKDGSMIQDEHRESLVPILMRIIYAKMIIKTGMRTGGKAGGMLRRKLILRFLAGTQEDEMITFVAMAFKPFKRYMSFCTDENANLKTLTCEIMDTIDLTNVTPPKRLQSAVNLLAIIIEQFGGKMANKLLPRLLGILFCILAEITGILKKSGQVHSGFLPSIKNVRSSCITILARFFSHFENYNWTEDEIDAFYDVAIYPQLEKLPIECIHSPTPLLKLLSAWSQNSRYYPLFIKHHENNKSLSPLPCIMQLLLGPKTHFSVINTILEMIEKMLTLQDYDKKSNEEIDYMETDVPLMPLTHKISNLLDINQELLSSGVNYGSTILLPHVSAILEYIGNKLKKSNKGINQTELIILSRISEFVTDADTCDTLLTLILPILVKKSGSNESEEIIIEFITTAINLIKNVKRPEIHIRSTSPLLATVTAVNARKLLIQFYKTIAENSTDESREMILQNCNLLTALNSWDQRWIDQADFQKRLDAFTEINKLIEEDKISLDFGVAIIYNCFYFLKNESDLAMRDFSGECLKTIGSKLANKHKGNIMERRYLMDDTILTILKKSITSKNEVLRLQSIAFLGHMATECSEVHPILQDLSLLTNKVDLEVDFFENMQHLQIHRRARALLKFCTVSKSLKKTLNPKTLTQFILPLASQYLCNEEFLHKNSIVDAAIETVGIVCKLLPWYHYEIILRYYLGKLRNIEYQKQVVRLIVVILDSFHYDLSKYKSEGVAQPENTLSLPDKEVTFRNNEETNESIVEQNNDANENQGIEEKFDGINNENLEGVEEVVEKTRTVDADVPVVEKQLLLSQYGAKKVIFSISKILLPQLHRSIIAKTHHDSAHKINRKKTAIETEEEDLMRVPIALALVKLLQKLPHGILDANLPGILMKLCTFLKSRLESVRRATREVLQKIMITLGPKYLHHLLQEMNTLLTKGFQVHVLVYTIQSVLVVLKPYFQKFDVNHNLQSILSVCKIDLFGLTAEEKEVIGIVKNVTEAKSTKSYDIFHILAEFITESCLLDLIVPLKDVLLKTHSHKTVQKVIECFRNIVLGLADNTFIPLDQMLIFLYGIVSESIPELMPEKKTKKITEKEAESLNRQKLDCFIIPAEPKNRMGLKAASKTSKNTNAHVMIEFGLKLFHILLKRDKISNLEFKPFLDPFVSLLSDCLKSQHVKLSTLALQCLSWVVKMDLESVHSLISEICSSIFGILHKYAAAGLSKGDNFDLVMTAFKCMAIIVRDVKHFTISAEQLKILILYAEQDMHNSDKQATAFTLLKAVIHRKMIVQEMHAVMEKVAKLSITSELEHVRQQSRSVFYSYLMEYPLGKQLDKYVSFYLSQLNYEVQPGRLSALEMVHNIVTGFPLKALIRRSGLIFVMVGARLINDDDPICRKLCAKCIKEMILRIPNNERDKLFDILLQWLDDTKTTHKTLAAQLCGLFVTIEKNEFESRLPTLIPLLLKQFHADSNNEMEPGRFVKIHRDDEAMNSNVKDPERLKDHHMFQVLQLLLKISAHCTAFLNNEKHKDAVRSFAEYCQSLLAHPHIWVRLEATQLIGFILAALDIDKIIKLLQNDEEYDPDDGYMYCDPVNTLKSLTLDLIAQLQPDMTFEELADQVVKNLIFIAKIFKSVKPGNNGIVKKDHKIEEKDSNNLSLPWLVRRLRKVVNIEITQSPKSTAVRTAMFKWIAGIVITIPMEDLTIVLFNIMSPLVREISTTEETNTPLRRLAKEITTMIKKRIGSEEYIRLLNQVQQKLNIKRTERKKIRTQQFVTDPELAAKRKIARQQKKKESRKRKLDSVRGKKVASRKRAKKEIDLDVF